MCYACCWRFDGWQDRRAGDCGAIVFRRLPTEVGARRGSQFARGTASHGTAYHSGPGNRQQPTEEASIIRLRLLLLHLIVALGAAACGASDPLDQGDPDESGISPRTFVDLYVELRIAEHEAESREDFDTRAEAILARHGATADDMLAFVDRHGTDVRLMVRVWSEIEERLRDPYAAEDPE